jgi:homoserine kinase type II
MTNDNGALKILLARYDLAPPVKSFALAEQGSNNATRGLRTGDGEFIWKTYQAHRDFTPLRHEHRLLAWLAKQQLSFAVPAPLYTRDGKTFCEGPDGWQALFPILPGASPLPLEAEHAEAIGAALGELQRILVHYPDTRLPGIAVYGDLSQIHAAVPNPFSIVPQQFGLASALSHEDIFGWWRTELAALRPFIKGAYRELPWQVIHGDFNTSNTLFHEGRLTSILDFEFAMRDARALDAASGLYFALRPASEAPRWHLAAALWRGYRQAAQPKAAEVAVIPWLMRLRNAGSSVGWLGRFSNANQMARWLERIGDMRRATEWLEQNHDRLSALLEA